jgi:hypothetical protein
VEPIRGAIRKGNWKLVKIATLPGKTELFDLSKDPGETTNVANQNPAIVRDLESRLLNYAKQQKPSEWIKPQPQFLGAQGKPSLILTLTSMTAACRRISPPCALLASAGVWKPPGSRQRREQMPRYPVDGLVYSGR